MKIKMNNLGITTNMQWTDEGFKNVVDTRLLEKRKEEVKNLSNFTLGDKKIYRISSVDFNEKVYDEDTGLCVRKYVGEKGGRFERTDNYVYVRHKGFTFVYHSQKEAEKDKFNRECFRKEYSYKTKKLSPYFYEIEDIKINGSDRNSTTYYLYDNAPIRIWFWLEDNNLYFYSECIDNIFRDEFSYCNLIDIKKEC